MSGSRRRAVALVGAAAVSGALLAGCLQNPSQGGAAGAGLAGFVDNAEADGDGVVTILGAFGGQEAEAFEASLTEFAESSGIDVQYTSDQDFTNTIRQRTGAGQAPDIAIFPQPGGLLEQAEDGYVQPIDTYLDFDALEDTLVPGFLEAGRLNGRVYGAPMRMAVKSLVWYNQATYAAQGYDTEPGDLGELAAITDQIRQSGTAPWCMGWNSDQATGWVGTDWIEEYMLRLWGPDVYDDWTSHEIPFDDERVIAAFDAFGELVLAEGAVAGGTQAVIATPFSESILPAFEDPPECYLERQGNFITGFMPEEVQANLDSTVGLFAFPPAVDGYEGQPILGGGDLAALMNGDDEDSIAVMEFLTSPDFGGPWAEAGGWLSPHTTFDTALYPDEITRRTAEIVAEADVFRYDGSDLMPNAVGGGSFWTGMVEWLTGAKTAEQVTAEIEASWPTSEEDS
ncbi:ABC transporter substrate-binding protein [Cellulomonas sp. ATA003]|uniref:ABC transporter substrate-binding protein n=1 Tax=Cellulomonas sp. ATA003 TaxID=3073064 RepID=UPI002872F950|nr:ABC transporter substrate-binding protein [Cellulomonas sp. ATA003]WNB85612.1 ABC transporter substrate-binding protein [Cellulomonas sp. ATA003]